MFKKYKMNKYITVNDKIIICKKDYTYMISEYNARLTYYDRLYLLYQELIKENLLLYKTNVELINYNKFLSNILQNALTRYNKLTVVKINEIYKNELLNYNYLLYNITQIINNSYDSIDIVKDDLTILKEICQTLINNITL